MKRVLLSVFVLLGSDCLAQNFECNKLIGTWKQEKYENKLQAHKIDFFQYKKDNTFLQVTYFESENKKWRQIESGNWACNGAEVGINTTYVNNSRVHFVDVYEILILNDTQRKFKKKHVDCENIITDCALTNESTKWNGSIPGVGSEPPESWLSKPDKTQKNSKNKSKEKNKSKAKTNSKGKATKEKAEEKIKEQPLQEEDN